tara:strand:- start:1709 stop:2023 length:315 start_codon:yes stop_codon:yes gene_type:complete
MNKQELCWTSSSGAIEVQLTQDMLDDQPVSGDCLPSVKLTSKLLLDQFRYPSSVIISEAVECGLWDYGNDNPPENKQTQIREAVEFLTWIAIGDLQDEQFEKNN